jgi:hypothetical protein
MKYFKMVPFTSLPVSLAENIRNNIMILLIFIYKILGCFQSSRCTTSWSEDTDGADQTKAYRDDILRAKN